jgi:hypothetical protein
MPRLSIVAALLIILLISGCGIAAQLRHIPEVQLTWTGISLFFVMKDDASTRCLEVMSLSLDQGFQWFSGCFEEPARPG